MGVFNKILGTIGLERKSLSNLEAFFAQGAVTASGVHANPVTAMRCPAVNAAVRIRTETISNLGLKLYRREGDAKKPATDHPLARLIHGWANPWMSSSKLIKALEFDCIAHGEGFALAVLAGGKIMELHRLKPGSVSVEYGNDLEPSYKVSQSAGGSVTYSWREILHVQSLNGLSPIKECSEAIGLAIALERYLALLLAKGARPSGLLKTKGKLTDPAFERLKKSWGAANSGENSAGVAILEDGTEFEALTFSSVDLEYMSARAFAVLEIGRGLGVPPNLMFDFTRQTYSNSEDASQSYLTHTILGRCTEWQDAIGRLLSDEDRDIYFAEFSTDSLVKADLAARFAAYSQAIASRFMNPNEVRAKENMAPYNGGDEFANPNTTAQIPPPVQRRQQRENA